MEELTMEQIIIKIWDWLGDRGVFFCKEKGNVFSNSPHTMLKCFDFVALKKINGVDMLYLSLKSETDCQCIVDCMESIANYDTFGDHLLDRPIMQICMNKITLKLNVLWTKTSSIYKIY